MKAFVLAAALIAAFGAPSQAATYFAFDSSSSSWVGRGFTDYFVSPETGWSFSVIGTPDHVQFSIRSQDPNAPLSNYYWGLEFDPPAGSQLYPGLFTGASRYPFNDDRTGLALTGNHRGNNTLSGFFEILQATYGPTGAVESFSANFTQYDEMQTGRWIVGEIRFNAVPEPTGGAAVMFAVIGALVVGMRRRKARVHH